MTPLPRLSAAAALAALLALPLAGCDDTPDDASVPDFCAALTDTSWADGLDETATGEEIVDALGEWGDELEETGTPDGIPDDAREGFEITIDTLHGLTPTTSTAPTTSATSTATSPTTSR